MEADAPYTQERPYRVRPASVIGRGVGDPALGAPAAAEQALAARLRAAAVPALAIQSAAAFLLIAQANAAARVSQPWAEWLFWLGLLLLYVPMGLALLAGDLTRGQRIGAILILGIGLFLCEAVSYPLGPASFDEMLHTRTAEDVLATGRLFNPNALLPVSPYYPGMENVTSALQMLTGLGLWPASIIGLGAARILLMLSIFLFAERISDSHRLASLAVLIYAANPRFLYFDSQFAYESLGLPLAAFVLAAAANRLRSPGSSRLELAGIVLVLLACVVTHPVTSIMLSGFLVLWTIARVVVPRVRRSAVAGPNPAFLALVAVIAVAGWAVLVAPQVISYIQPPVERALGQLVELASGESEGRPLFQSAGGEIAPLWERVVGYGSVLVVVAVLPFGLRELWRRYRDSPVAWVIALVAVSYPVLALGRLTPLGGEIAARTPEFVFLGVGISVAAFLTGRLGVAWKSRRRLAAAAMAGAVVFVGGVVVGIPGWQRLPGPYLASADARSLEPNGIASGLWARAHLGTDNRMIADRVNTLLMGVYGHQEMIVANNELVDLNAFYQRFAFGLAQRELVYRQNVRYALVDLRLTRFLPTVGFYFQRQELEAGVRTAPLRRAGLEKFDTAAGLDRVFDNGDIRIYDVSSLDRAVPR